MTTTIEQYLLFAWTVFCLTLAFLLLRLVLRDRFRQTEPTQSLTIDRAGTAVEMSGRLTIAHVKLHIHLPAKLTERMHIRAELTCPCRQLTYVGGSLEAMQLLNDGPRITCSHCNADLTPAIEAIKTRLAELSLHLKTQYARN